MASQNVVGKLYWNLYVGLDDLRHLGWWESVTASSPLFTASVSYQSFIVLAISFGVDAGESRQISTRMISNKQKFSV